MELPGSQAPAATAPSLPEDGASGAAVVLHAINPATRQILACVFTTPPSRIRALVAQAQGAAQRWGALSFRQRGEALARLREAVAQRGREIAETIACGMGKPLIEALSFEVARVIETLDDCIAHARDDLAEEPVAAVITLPALLGRYRSVLLPHTPRAVVCVIAPVSSPFELAVVPAVIALAAGNAVIVKPTSSAPLVGLLIERLFDEVFADIAGLAQVVHGAGELGASLATATGVDVVLFAGSAAVGHKLQAALALLQRPAFVQLGGADALVVCDDANLERAAAATVYGRFSNSGQASAAVKRVYVQRAVAETFLHKVIHKVRALKSGPYTDPFCETGPLANGRALQDLRAVLQNALDQGASILAGGFPAHVTGHDHGERRGADRQGWYWPPTVLTRVDHTMRVMKEAVSGPILPIQVVEDDREAITLANDTAFGFDACVFSADLERAQRIAGELHAGSVAVNDVFVHVAERDKRAGTARPPIAGRERSDERRADPDCADPAPAGEPGRLLLDDGSTDREPHWFPYSAARLRTLELALAAPGRRTG